MDVTQYKDSADCQCRECQRYCRRPCWGTPAEVSRLLDAGYADRLMLDWWQQDEPIAILCGALKGYEGELAPDMPISDDGCTFWVDGLCQLHEVGLKPLEGRVAHHSNKPDDKLHGEVAKLWDSEDGRAVIARWRELTGCEGNAWDDYDPLDSIFSLWSI